VTYHDASAGIDHFAEKRRQEVGRKFAPVSRLMSVHAEDDKVCFALSL
jgi:hypothetical protein